MFPEVSRFQINNILTQIYFCLSSLRTGGFSFLKVFENDLLLLTLRDSDPADLKSCGALTLVGCQMPPKLLYQSLFSAGCGREK